MKKTILTAITAVCCFTCFSQVNNENDQKSDRNSRVILPVKNEPINQVSNKEAEAPSKPQTISKRAGEPQREHDATYYTDEIAKIDANLNAIDQKKEYIISNAEENELAESNGWFAKMEEVKAQLLIKREELLTKLNNLD